MLRLVIGMVAALLTLGIAQAQQKQPEPAWITDKNGCRVWDSEPRPNESIMWSGACPDGFADGPGVLQWFENGKPNERYEGDVRRGRYNGHGVAQWTNGNRYDGEWRDNRKNGHGAYVWANGDRYEGSYRDDLAYGSGTLRKADGQIYLGNWISGCFRDGDRRAVVGPKPLADCP